MLKYYRIKDLAKVSTGGTPSREDEGNFTSNKNDGIMWIKPEDLKGTKDFIRETREYITCLGLKKMKKFSPHDSIIFSGIGEIGKMGIAKNDFTTNQQNHILYSISCNRDYLFYSLFSKRKNINKLAKGNVVKIFNSSELKRIIVGIPENEKQLKIVKYLRKNENSLEDKIKKYNKKIELLKEYKEALIYETVTKGLDKNVEMKDSGIDYIGLCPKKWSIKRIKNFYKLGMGQTILKEDVLDEGLYPILSATEKDVVFGYLNKINIMLRENDMVIPARGNSIGFVKIIRKESGCTQTTIYMKKNKNKHVLPKYVYYYLIGNKKFIFNYNNTAIPQITVNDINGKELLCPSIIEQNKIVDFLDKKTKEIDSEVEKLSKKIELIEELKESIIYECVTGKIDIEIEGEKYQKIIESI